MAFPGRTNIVHHLHEFAREVRLAGTASTGNSSCFRTRSLDAGDVPGAGLPGHSN